MIMGACKRMGIWVGVGMSATVLALPACFLLAWLAVGCMWVLGLLSVMKLVLRLMWKPRIVAMEEERKLQRRARKTKAAAGLMSSDGTQQQQVDTAEMRLSLFQQYLEDQLNTLGHQLFHVCRSDSPPINQVAHLPLHVDSCDWVLNHVDDDDRLQIREAESDQQMLGL